MLRGVQIGPEVQLVVGLSDPDDLGKVAGLKPRFKLEAVWQGCEVDLWIDRSCSWFWRSAMARRSSHTSAETRFWAEF